MKARICRLLIRVLVLALASLGARMPMHSAPMLPEADLSWKNVEVGGKKRAVFCLLRDSRGLMWLGTNDGLFFYDGVSARSVGEVVLSGSQIYSIVESGDRLYLGSNNGLMTYDYATGCVEQCAEPTPKEIRALLLADEVLWIGGLNGICRMDLRQDSIAECSRGLPHRSVYSLLLDSRGILYAGTYGGVARWDGRLGEFRPLNASGTAPVFANCLLESPDGESIYVGGEGALSKYTPARDQWERVALVENNVVKSLAHGDDGHILIGTDEGVFDLCNDAIRHYRHDSRNELSIADNEVWCIYADCEHNVWAGHDRGVSIASNSGSIRTIKLGALSRTGDGNEIRTIYRTSGGDLWFGGTNGAIRVDDGGEARWYRHSSNQNTLSHNKIRSIIEDCGHSIWLATDAGVNRFDAAKEDFDVFYIADDKGEHKSNWVYALVEDGESFWIGTFLNGIHRARKSDFGADGGTIVADMSINSDNKAGKDMGLPNDLINNMAIDLNGNMWILLFRDNAITKFDPSNGESERFDIYDIAGGYPTHVAIDRRGRVWCAFKGGAVVFGPDSDYSLVRFPHTSSDETILALGPVGDDMWISTQSNVWKVDGKSLDATLLPIPQKPYTAVYEDTASGDVYLGGTDEIIVAESEIMGRARDYKTIKMVLCDSGDRQLRPLGPEGIAIPYGGSLTLLVSSLDYSPETAQRYMYKLAESAADTLDAWIVLPAGVNSISLSDLKMGDYNVLVRSIDSPAPPIAVPLKVKAPLALSWWAIAIYVFIVIAIALWAVWWAKKRHVRELREQERRTALENVEKKLTFLSSISHDLKTPLSMILGPVSVMKEKTSDPEDKRSLEIVYDNAVRLNNMIHRTLEMQHLEDADESLLINSTFDVVDFCKSVFEVFKESHRQKHFIFHASCASIFIEADAVKFESVMTNLLSNACKYSDDGATISCGISRRDDEVEIIVSDDGIGISDIDQPLVFQRMFRAPSISKLKEGTGLGLYLIKRYLELMKGNIALYSKEGQGTAFVVTVPISDKASKIREASDEADSGKPKILIVEDNVQIAGFIAEILRDGYTCLAAENGRSGLAIAASFAPDLIIADEMMPIMSGIEMVKQIKQYPRLSSIPIIMLTAKSDNATENESIKAGIDAFMSKPFEPGALLARIRQLLKSRYEMKERARMQVIAEAEAKPIEAESVNEKALAKIAKIIEDNVSDPDLNVNQLSEKAGIGQKQLYRLIKKYIGVSPVDYIRRVRLQKAAMLLSQHRFTVSEVSYMVGFKTPSYFTKCFQNQYGVKPSMYRSDDESISDIGQNPV